MKPESVNIFLDKLERIGNELIESIRDLNAKGLSDVELYNLINQLDFFQELSELGYLEEVQAFLNQYDNNITQLIDLAEERGLSSLSTISIEQLDNLKDLDGEWILKRGEMYSSQLKKDLLSSLVAGTQPKEFFGDLLNQINSKAPFKPNWLETAIHTSYANFNAVATKKVFEDLPETRFILKGPNDERTRYACQHVLKNQPEGGMTVEEIEKFPYMVKPGLQEGFYTFEQRGRFNCRHYWVLAEEEK